MRDTSAILCTACELLARGGFESPAWFVCATCGAERAKARATMRGEYVARLRVEHQPVYAAKAEAKTWHAIGVPWVPMRERVRLTHAEAEYVSEARGWAQQRERMFQRMATPPQY